MIFHENLPDRSCGYANAQPFPFPCRVYDTLTGEVERFLLKGGRFVIGPNQQVATLIETRPTPLRFESLDDKFGTLVILESDR